MRRYQDIYPSAPLLRSDDSTRSLAAGLLTLEYFEAEPASMPSSVFAQHHILINLKDEPHRVENWRDGERRDFTFHKNEIVVTPAGVDSGWRWHAKSRCIVITITPERLERFAHTELGVLLTPQQLVDQPQFEDADIAGAAFNAYSELEESGHGSAVMYESLVRVFLVKLIRRYGIERDEEHQFSKAFTAEHYRRVLDHVAKRYGTPIAVEDLAEVAGLSASHFSRLFRETIGETPHRFITAYRVEQSQKMLEDATKPLLDVALICGFSDQPHFTRVFKKHTGMTPKQFRASLDT